ncbi:MAG: hypothetical protein AB1705_00055 [Verrucomicrobiota bacterium]
MNRAAVIFGVLLVLVTAGLAYVIHTQDKAHAALAAQLAAAQTSNVQFQQELAAREAATKEQAARLTALTEMLTETTAKLNVTSARLADYKKHADQVAAEEAAAAKKEADLLAKKDEVPAPSITVTTDRSGRQTQTYVFPKLLGPGGQVLAAEAEFGSAYGRRFVFRREGAAPLAFDVDELHPGVLLHLGLKPEAVKQAAAELEQKNRLQEAIYYQKLAARRAAEQKAASEQAKFQLELAKLQEESRKAQAEEALQLRAVENDRLRAEATIRQSEASINDPWRALFPNYIFNYQNPIFVGPNTQPVEPVPQPNPFVRDPRAN